ncbi:hypothetical protein JCM19241_2873 [Vibrio ishigakensis]|uniref:Uncharacterized protein n=1 Tax=Vibrio ishigakensis TaxID=1481914 RepID=A0A0B8QE24_9VIBR|nr:hypothetical protein JCM19241_2873 [Vibrio ishigakensis]
MADHITKGAAVHLGYAPLRSSIIESQNTEGSVYPEAVKVAEGKLTITHQQVV